MINLPNDPILLLSVVNTKLRDYYKNLDVLCEDMSVDKTEMIQKLEGIGYTYDERKNQVCVGGLHSCKSVFYIV